MVNKKLQAGIALILISIISILSWFLYLAYKGNFEPLFVSAVATSALVLVTAVSVILTILLLREERQSRRQQIIPIFKLGKEGTVINPLNVIAQNIGNGPAKNIRGKVILKPQNEEIDFEYPNVPSGEILPIGNIPEDIEFEDIDKITISGECEDILGNKHQINDEQEVRDRAKGTILMDRDKKEKHLRDIADNLKDIRRDMGRL